MGLAARSNWLKLTVRFVTARSLRSFERGVVGFQSSGRLCRLRFCCFDRFTVFEAGAIFASGSRRFAGDGGQVSLGEIGSVSCCEWIERWAAGSEDMVVCP